MFFDSIRLVSICTACQLEYFVEVISVEKKAPVEQRQKNERQREKKSTCSVQTFRHFAVILDFIINSVKTPQMQTFDALTSSLSVSSMISFNGRTGTDLCLIGACLTWLKMS